MIDGDVQDPASDPRERQRMVGKVMGAITAASVPPPQGQCKVDRLAGVDERYLPNAKKVLAMITEMIRKGQAPRSIVAHINDSGLWGSWPEKERISYSTIRTHARRRPVLAQAVANH